MSSDDTAARRNCRELFAQLSDYIDGDLDPGICEEIDRHMEGCDPCVAFVESLRRTVKLVETHPGEPLPDGLRHELLEQATRLKKR